MILAMAYRWIKYSFCLLLFPCLLLANSGDLEIVQPVESPSGLVLVTDSQSTQVVTPDGRDQSIPLIEGEILTDFVEVRNGWVGAGFSNQGERNQLIFYADGIGGLGRLRGPNPDSESAFGSFRPTLIVRDHSLDGVAWLEGDTLTSMAVRAAFWSGLEWGPIEEVSPPGPGSQTGLTGTVLPDGSWLLVWARFDGNDDEIYWSMRRGETWSEPRRVDANNEVPDVTPHLVTTETGALLAWSRYDGSEYRLAASRLVGESWQAPRYVAPRGSLAPRFGKHGENIFLTYREAAPRAWSILELNDRGDTLRRARLEESRLARPITRDRSRGQISLEWPDETERKSLRWEIIP
jgi:hypothetical protein